MMTARQLIAIIHSIRDICLRKYPLDIYLKSAKGKDDRLGIDKPEELSDFLFYELVNLPAMNIPKLLKTPRSLKATLRRTVKTWDILHGEIDLNDLIILNVLRYGAPEALDFLMDNL
jgi:hypothetical protein